MMRALLLSLILAAAAPAQDKSVLPRWLEFNIEQRSRPEGRTGLGFEPGENDACYLSRLRFNIGLLASDWLRFDIQVQDSRQAGERKPLPAKVLNPFHLRGPASTSGSATRAGCSAPAGRHSNTAMRA
jgi:hypothetical protein